MLVKVHEQPIGLIRWVEIVVEKLYGSVFVYVEIGLAKDAHLGQVFVEHWGRRYGQAYDQLKHHWQQEGDERQHVAAVKDFQPLVEQTWHLLTPQMNALFEDRFVSQCFQKLEYN